MAKQTNNKSNETNPEWVQFVVDNISPPDDNQCELWTGRYNKGNLLGGITYNNKYTLINRLIYKWHTKKELPSDKTIRMSCQNTLCCNPHHMFLIRKITDRTSYLLHKQADYAYIGENIE